MFSIPINPKLRESEFKRFYSFLQENKDVIYDLYFTSRMPPFVQDAMGDVFDVNDMAPIETALYIQQSLGIPVSATFNNVMVRPSQENLDLFIHNFRMLYDIGVRSATIPHSHWLATRQIQKEFPELQIKNTILRNVTQAQEVARLAEVGFHYINLDRDLMRNRDELIKIRRAADKYGVKISLLGNEGCLGGCPMMDEHFQFNNTRTGNSPQYFNDSISRVSCPKWEIEDSATSLKTANIPPWREDWVDLLQYVDVFKMHGRESVKQLFNTMDIVKRYRNNEPILFNDFDEYLNETNLVNKPITVWREKIKNCKFDCWECNYCDQVYQAKSKIKQHPLVYAVTKELVDSVNVTLQSSVQGLTSNRVRQLLYSLAKHCDNYLEIGSAMGATATAVAESNIHMHCVDSWKLNVQPESGEFELPDNTKDIFVKNMNGYDNLIIHDCDLFYTERKKIKDIDLFFYDGSHDVNITARAISHYYDCFADTAILVFDDANWQGVVQGADLGISMSKLKVLYSKKLLNSAENKGMWWNGLYIVVVQK
jgi:hypothetical protein